MNSNRNPVAAATHADGLFFTTGELAEMKLPGMPKTTRGVRYLIKRRCRGGLIPEEYVRRSFKSSRGMAYHYKCLPERIARAFEHGLGEKPRPRSPDAVLAQLGILVPGARLVIRVPARTRRIAEPAI